jgi:Phospholipase_D-nuclease N-terminal
MALGDGLLALLVLGFWLFCLFDVITTDESQMRNLSKIWWLVIVLFFVVVGSVMWLVAGRPQGAGAPGSASTRGGGAAGAGGTRASRYGGGAGLAPARRPLAPDDDPEFLESVGRHTAEDKDMLRRWEDDLRRREEELRKRSEDSPGPDDGATPAG